MSHMPTYNAEGTFQYTKAPNPNWKFGDKLDATAQGKAWIEGENAGWKHIDTSAEDPAFV